MRLTYVADPELAAQTIAESTILASMDGAGDTVMHVAEREGEDIYIFEPLRARGIFVLQPAGPDDGGSDHDHARAIRSGRP